MIHRRLPTLTPNAPAIPRRWRLPFAIDEPDVTLTDVGLALETAIFAVVLARKPTRWPRLRRWSSALFGTAAVASLAGAADHGLLRREGRQCGRDVARATTLLALGASAVALVAIGAEIGLPRATARRLLAITAVAATGYAAIVLVGPRHFVIAILGYVPSALFLLWILCRRFTQQRDRGSLLGIAAVLLALAAAGIQRLEIGIHPRYLGSNALFHVIQALSFALFFGAARDLLEASGQPDPIRPRAHLAPGRSVERPDLPH